MILCMKLLVQKEEDSRKQCCPIQWSTKRDVSTSFTMVKEEFDLDKERELWHEKLWHQVELTSENNEKNKAKLQEVMRKHVSARNQDR